MSEPLAEHLSRFTPSTAGLDRDALLFAAGRASVRPNRGWITLAGVLAASQVLTLACLWPRTPPAAPPASVAVQQPAVTVAPPPATTSEPSELGALHQRLLVSENDWPTPAVVESMVPAPPPLRVSGAPPETILN